ncbi:hypothetical protein TPHA_0A05420 [Tetrapisispora phaffii CBS 4417]|uniref:Aminodeoxychorismate lyase n=1 Tax=Tetrapisispora phaffii (strain ATCC 24235 / CBS 4417 / NBRC 1672 / NRRL Y-8282 / UCD 70-5) TaxID=1071381 RepID=G8BNY8_TETPH|nr:hypothetical protein TPHA_0A05420 [Tetrapisispora phaffii CBS 4417]CCE61616.1 hypothetical protein TPHA_0A05420 [Tetrapisispora phaffii CBS 4417]
MSSSEFSHVKGSSDITNDFKILSTIRYDPNLFTSDSNSFDGIESLSDIEKTGLYKKLKSAYIEDFNKQRKEFHKSIDKKVLNCDKKLLSLFFNRYFLLHDHYERIKFSCKYFEWNFNYSELEFLTLLIRALPKNNDIKNSTVDETMREFLNKRTVYKVRALLSVNGEFEIEYHKISDLDDEEQPSFDYVIKNIFSGFIPELEPTWNIVIDRVHLHCSPFTSFKTTIREHYSEARVRMQKVIENLHMNNSKNEILLLNASGKFVEGSITNLVIKYNFSDDNTSYATPPLESGCLYGVMRNYLLRLGIIRERVIESSEININDNIIICNAIMGCVKGKIIH